MECDLGVAFRAPLSMICARELHTIVTAHRRSRFVELGEEFIRRRSTELGTWNNGNTRELRHRAIQTEFQSPHLCVWAVYFPAYLLFKGSSRHPPKVICVTALSVGLLVACRVNVVKLLLRPSYSVLVLVAVINGDLVLPFLHVLER